MQIQKYTMGRVVRKNQTIRYTSFSSKFVSEISPIQLRIIQAKVPAEMAAALYRKNLRSLINLSRSTSLTMTAAQRISRKKKTNCNPSVTSRKVKKTVSSRGIRSSRKGVCPIKK